jgi:hypothetical protein
VGVSMQGIGRFRVWRIAYRDGPKEALLFDAYSQILFPNMFIDYDANLVYRWKVNRTGMRWCFGQEWPTMLNVTE